MSKKKKKKKWGIGYIEKVDMCFYFKKKKLES